MDDHSFRLGDHGRYSTEACRVRFSILSIIALFLPVAFFVLGLAEQRSEDAAIQWQPFTVVSMQQHLEKGRPALILGAPQGFIGPISSMAIAEFESPMIREHCHTENYAMLKFEYTPWGSYDPSIQPELKWMGEHGGYNEPSLVLVNPDGTTSAIKHIISSGRISDFLSPNQKLTRRSVYYWIAALLIAGWVTAVMMGRRNSVR